MEMGGWVGMHMGRGRHRVLDKAAMSKRLAPIALLSIGILIMIWALKVKKRRMHRTLDLHTG
jgi:hypothetical protein